jgi:hypothetical protein
MRRPPSGRGYGPGRAREGRHVLAAFDDQLPVPGRIALVAQLEGGRSVPMASGIGSQVTAG